MKRICAYLCVASNSLSIGLGDDDCLGIRRYRANRFRKYRCAQCQVEDNAGLMSDSEKLNRVHLGETPVCPDCGAATKAGDFSVGQSVSSLVIDGLAWPDLFFTARGDSRWSRESMGFDKRSGWFCPKCGFIMIRGVVAAKVEEDLRNRAKISTDRQLLPKYAERKKDERG